MKVTRIKHKKYWCVNCDEKIAEYEIGDSRGSFRLMWCCGDTDGQITLCKECYQELLKKMSLLWKDNNYGKT